MILKLLTGTAVVLFTITADAQYCMSGGPTSTADSNVQLVKLTSTADSINHIGCPGVLGVQNLTTQSVSLVAGNTYILKVQFGTCGGNYLGSGETWIDYDQSETFDVSESVGTWTGTPPVALSVYTFTVPLTAHNGSTRMRVLQHEGSNIVPPLDPCASYQWGSVMDFTINISGGINCTNIIGDRKTSPIIVSTLPYTDTRDASYCYGNQNPVYPSPDVYYLLTPSVQVSSIHASLCGSTFDTFLSVIDKYGNVLAYNDDANGCAPQSELTFYTAGIDSAYVIVEGWGVSTGIYTLQLTADFVGIGEYDLPDFAIYPNPISIGTSFSIKGNISGNISITDVIGNTIAVIPNYKGESISTTSFSAGIYFIRIEYKGQSISKKLIIAE